MAEYDYTCPHCSKHCYVDDSLVGQDLACPSCSKQFFATPPQPEPEKIPFLKSHRREMLQKKFDEIVAKGPIDERAKLELDAYAVGLGLETYEVQNLQQAKFSTEFEPIKKRIEGSLKLTDEDMQSQLMLEKKYGIRASLIGEANLFRAIYSLEIKNQLPTPISTDLMLTAKEEAYYSISTTWYQPRAAARGYAGTSISIPSGIRGVRFSFGSYTPSRSPEQMTALSDGVLYVTSKRLLFNGSARNTSIILSKIIDGQMYSDALRVEKGSGKPDLFSMNLREARYILALIGKLK